VTNNHGYTDFWVVKLNSQGGLDWQKAHGGSYEEVGRFIIQTNEGGYIAAGSTASNDGEVSGNNGGMDYWVVKMTSSGDIEWQKALGGTDDDEAMYIQQTADQGYVVGGFSYSNDGDVTGNHGDLDYWIVKLTGSGDMEWQKSLGGSGSDEFNAIKEIPGGYAIGGFSDSNDGDVTGNHGSTDYWIVKLNQAGNTILWEKSFGGSNSDEAYDIKKTTDDALIITGSSESFDGDVIGNHGSADYWVVKITSPTAVNELSQQISYQLYPNPAAENVIVRSDKRIDNIQLLNSTGMVTGVVIKHHGAEVILETGQLPDGMYMLQFDIEGQRVNEKVVIER
jgi:hypothetical protein